MDTEFYSEFQKVMDLGYGENLDNVDRALVIVTCMLDEYPNCPTLLLEKARLIQLSNGALSDLNLGLADADECFKRVQIIDPLSIEAAYHYAFFLDVTNLGKRWHENAQNQVRKFYHLIKPEMTKAEYVLKRELGEITFHNLTLPSVSRNLLSQFINDTVPNQVAVRPIKRNQADDLSKTPGNGRLIFEQAARIIASPSSELSMAEKDLLKATLLWTYKTEAYGKLFEFYEHIRGARNKVVAYAQLYYCRIVRRLDDIARTIISVPTLESEESWLLHNSRMQDEALRAI